MTYSSSGNEFIALDCVVTKIITRTKGAVHLINRERFYYTDRFYEYRRMTRETFDYILRKVVHILNLTVSTRN